MDLVVDVHKLLQPGVHDASMDAVEALFGKFQRSDRRIKLFAKLAEYVEAVRKAGCGACVIIDGSFLMGCIDEPEDVDLILVLPPNWDEAAELRPYQYNLVSKRMVKKTYKFDVFVVASGSPDEAEWIEFFGRVNLKWCQKFGWPNDTRKGIVRVVI